METMMKLLGYCWNNLSWKGRVIGLIAAIILLFILFATAKKLLLIAFWIGVVAVIGYAIYWVRSKMKAEPPSNDKKA